MYIITSYAVYHQILDVSYRLQSNLIVLSFHAENNSRYLVHIGWVAPSSLPLRRGTPLVHGIASLSNNTAVPSRLSL